MFSRRRYITARVSKEVDPITQFFLWSCIDMLPVKADYLQIFELVAVPNGLKVIHSQEVPEYKKGKRVTKSAAWASIISSLSLTVFLIVFLGYLRADFSCSFGDAIKNGMQSSPFIGVVCMPTISVTQISTEILMRSPFFTMLFLSIFLILIIEPH